MGNEIPTLPCHRSFDPACSIKVGMTNAMDHSLNLRNKKPGAMN